MSQSISNGNWEEENRKKREAEVKKVVEELRQRHFIAQADAEQKARAIVDEAYAKRQAALRYGGR